MAAALTQANGQQTLDSFLSQTTFSVDLCNTVLVLWIMLHALPFNRFYDPPLRAAFKLANRRADLRSPTWAAGVAKDLYVSLSAAAISLVKVCGTSLVSLYITLLIPILTLYFLETFKEKLKSILFNA